jgi:hypothetical protein
MQGAIFHRLNLGVDNAHTSQHLSRRYPQSIQYTITRKYYNDFLSCADLDKRRCSSPLSLPTQHSLGTAGLKP